MFPKLKELRTNKGLSQTDVAKMLGMSQAGYSKYETGKNDIPMQILIKLMDFYNISADYMLGITKEIRSYPSEK